jgi:transposase
MAQRHIDLSSGQRQELIRIRDTADKPYLRERAAAILKVADGTPAAVVARQGLLRQRKPDTIYDWLNRFHDEGVAGLCIRPGRGRKPSLSSDNAQQEHSAHGSSA